MGKVITVKNLYAKRYRTMEFDGRWLASFGNPDVSGSWLVWGKSGSGKTTFLLMLSKYLTQFERVLYLSYEERDGRTFRNACKRVGMEECGQKFMPVIDESIEELQKRLLKKKSPNIVVVDSLSILDGFYKKHYLDLKKKFPNKLFIFSSHEQNSMHHPKIAETVRRFSDLKIHVAGYTAYTTSRYQTETEGGADFVVWEKGAMEFNGKR